MNIFEFRNQLIGDYASYIQSFIQIRDPQIRDFVQQKLTEGILWPEPLIQLNPLFERGESIDELVAQGVLHPECARIFRKEKTERDGTSPRQFALHAAGRAMSSRPGPDRARAWRTSSPSSTTCCATDRVRVSAPSSSIP